MPTSQTFREITNITLYSLIHKNNDKTVFSLKAQYAQQKYQHTPSYQGFLIYPYPKQHVHQQAINHIHNSLANKKIITIHSKSYLCICQTKIFKIRQQLNIIKHLSPIQLLVLNTHLGYQKQFLKSMNKSIDAFCNNGRPVDKLCNNQLCKKTSLMCSNQSCDCNTIHEDCAMNVPFSSVTKKLSVKAMSYLPLKQSQVEWYHKQVKHFNRLIEQTQKSIDEGELILQGDEGKLYQLLMNKKYQEVTSDIVYRAVTNLLKQPKIDLNYRMSQLQKQMKEASQDIERASEKMRIMRGKIQEQKIQTQNNSILNSFYLSPNNKFRFSQSLHHADIQVQWNSIVKTAENENWRLSLLQPALSVDVNSERSKLKFRIVRSKYTFLFFGVCQLKGETTKRFQAINTTQGLGEDKVVLGAYNGLTYSHLDKQKDWKQSPIKRVKVWDVFEVSFYPRNSTVTFTNENTRETAVINIKQKITHPLHYCVVLYSKDDKVEIF